MIGITEHLPGLPDDPQVQRQQLTTSNAEYQIPPLRNPIPSTRPANAPSPLEPIAASSSINNGGSGGSQNVRATHSRLAQLEEQPSGKKRSTPKLTPTTVLGAKSAKDARLAISELLDETQDVDIQPNQLPSYIHPAAVEISPTQASIQPDHTHTLKRPRLEIDMDPPSREANRVLPRPAQKESRIPRCAPLIPAMVTGLHEPPPSARVLPSMIDDSFERPSQSFMQGKGALTNTSMAVPTKFLDSMLNADNDNTTTKRNADSMNDQSHSNLGTPTDATFPIPMTTGKDYKPRRARRKWSEIETTFLLAGVKKHGIGKWKQILDDPEYEFVHRNSVDLKDRWRVCAKEEHGDVASSRQGVTVKLRRGGSSVSESLSTSGKDDITMSNVQTSRSTIAMQSDKTRPRRKRRAWTDEEDAGLTTGLMKHGFSWTAIQADPELNLQQRRATDLRDRIRNRSPHRYKNAETAPLRSEIRKAVNETVNTSNPSKDKANIGTIRIDKHKDNMEQTPLLDPQSPRNSAQEQHTASTVQGVSMSQILNTPMESTSSTVIDPARDLLYLPSSSNIEQHTSAQSHTSWQAQAINPTSTNITSTPSSSTNTAQMPGYSDLHALLNTPSSSTSLPELTNMGLTSTSASAAATSLASVTLPKLAIDDNEDQDWGDNTLPPFLDRDWDMYLRKDPG